MMTSGHPLVPQAPNTGDEIRENIRQAIQEATQGAREAAAEARAAAQRVRTTEQHVRAAEMHVREAGSPSEMRVAQIELREAQAALREAQAELAGFQRAGARPGFVYTTGTAGQFPNDVIPPQVVDIAIAFAIMMAVIVIGWPIARAFGRRIERRSVSPGLTDPALAGQLQRIEQAVEAMSIEIERISEGQRFLTRLQGGAASERTPLGTGERH